MSEKYVTGNLAKYLAGTAWAQTYYYAYASGRVKYICKNVSIYAALADNTWYTWKYDDAELPRSEGPRIATAGIAAVADVDGLAWGF